MTDHQILADLHQVVTAFCRGVDRRDPEILASCFTPDATDNHGVYRGSAAGFVTWVTEATAAMGFMQHAVSNLHVLSAQDDRATSETYYHMRCVGTDGEIAAVFGRYLDTWARHDGRWLIADRLCLVEWSSPNSGFPADLFENGATDRSDPSYSLTPSHA
ncbi:MAG TPA: nuclear transport factor 2 family protein [Sporichthyaceae bacterium]